MTKDRDKKHNNCVFFIHFVNYDLELFFCFWSKEGGCNKKIYVCINKSASLTRNVITKEKDKVTKDMIFFSFVFIQYDF